jgi:hypothetical protein
MFKLIDLVVAIAVICVKQWIQSIVTSFKSYAHQPFEVAID